jgi:hypothetical protein
MSAKDIIHGAVRTALENDGWTITHDPLTLKYEDKSVFIDLAAERWILAAERENEKIAVEIKSFISASIIQDLEVAFGQYMVYLSFLKRVESDRKLYIAITDVTYSIFLESQAIQMLLTDNHVPLIIMNPVTKEIVQWIQN